MTRHCLGVSYFNQSVKIGDSIKMVIRSKWINRAIVVTSNFKPVYNYVGLTYTYLLLTRILIYKVMLFDYNNID